MKNEPQKAVDCVVRALHFSPRYCQAGEKATDIVNGILNKAAYRCSHSYNVCVCLCALHISRQQKDVALVNMANILHRAHFSADAAILAHAALDLTSDLFTSHYTLGNVYAVSQRESSSPQLRFMYLTAHWLTIYYVINTWHNSITSIVCV